MASTKFVNILPLSNPTPGYCLLDPPPPPPGLFGGLGQGQPPHPPTDPPQPPKGRGGYPHVPRHTKETKLCFGFLSFAKVAYCLGELRGSACWPAAHRFSLSRIHKQMMSWGARTRGEHRGKDSGNAIHDLKPTALHCCHFQPLFHQRLNKKNRYPPEKEGEAPLPKPSETRSQPPARPHGARSSSPSSPSPRASPRVAQCFAVPCRAAGHRTAGHAPLGASCCHKKQLPCRALDLVSCLSSQFTPTPHQGPYQQTRWGGFQTASFHPERPPPPPGGGHVQEVGGGGGWTRGGAGY